MKKNIKIMLDMGCKSVKTLLVLGVMVAVASCGTPKTKHTGISDPVRRPAVAKGSGHIEQQLRAEYELWKGTKHKLGGMDKSGVDCSGFVKYIYQKLFNITLPRTTKSQVTSGRQVKRSRLATGDLVFFKPPGSSRHVGIYLSDDEFVHASKSNGVIISEISPAYWSKYYWTARRVLPD